MTCGSRLELSIDNATRRHLVSKPPAGLALCKHNGSGRGLMNSISADGRIDQSDYLKPQIQRRIMRAGGSILSKVAAQPSSTGGSKT